MPWLSAKESASSKIMLDLAMQRPVFGIFAGVMHVDTRRVDAPVAGD